MHKMGAIFAENNKLGVWWNIKDGSGQQTKDRRLFMEVGKRCWVWTRRGELAPAGDGEGADIFARAGKVGGDGQAG